MRYSFILFLMILCFGCKPKHNVPETVELNNNWQFKKLTDSVWNLANVPGNVHSDLLENNLIEDPFVANNELDLQWISKEDWEYKTIFTVDNKTLSKKHLELNFKGLDTYTKVFLNDSLILKSNNAFREFKVDVKPLLKTENELRIVFENTTVIEDKENAKTSYELPEGNRVFTRKPQFQYGWDWGPKFNTSGISKPIELMAWDDYKIEDFYVEQLVLNDSVADLIFRINYETQIDVRLTYEFYINDELESTQYWNTKYMSAGFPFQIKKPKKWWPHNIGEPYLYDIKCIVKNGNQILDSVSVKHGIRTIKLVTEKDSIGKSFFFKVNGVPIYAKGANYIPQNSFQNQVKDEDYEKLLNDVVDANMNMLRVWGGGIYENDIFYDLCDEKGILVWQDFMYACAMYPGDEAFLNNAKIEAEQQVKRLRNHASIALWCGNNESREGWKRWGWQSGRSEEEKEEIFSNYKELFNNTLPSVVAQNTNTDYWESSPSYGRGNPKYKTEGDAHDWWIWHDEYPFEHLQGNVPRFMSEFGFQSFPSYEAIKYINGNDSISISSQAFSTHQKHSRGFSIIKNYMERDFPVPTNDEDYVYVSQLLQAHGITMGIEAQRRAKPYNMGTLYWQLNDCWPVTSWSSIDFMGNWKALHYKAKHSFENILISSRVQNDTLKTYIVNDNLEPEEGLLDVKILDFNGQQLSQKMISTKAKANMSQLLLEWDLKTLGVNFSEVVLVTTFNQAKSIQYLVKPKDLKLIQGDIQQKIIKTNDGFAIELSSKVLQKDVFLISEEKGHFSDNFFDLLPNETRVIQFNTKALQLNDLKIKTFNNLLR